MVDVYAMRKALNHLKKSDPVLRAIIESVGPCRMEYSSPEFSSLAEAILYQQLNGKAAGQFTNDSRHSRAIRPHRKAF